MMRGDHVVERAASRLETTAQRLAAEGGTKAKLAEFLADDAALIRSMKPSLIRARLKGEARTDAPPGSGSPRAPGLMQLGQRPQPEGGSGGGGPSPLVVVGAAFAVGIVLAKMIDWRGHAHPRL